jgi:hypothetical protein
MFGEKHSCGSTRTALRNSIAVSVAALCMSASAAPALAASITTFDVPGALHTVALGINAGGSVTGYYVASNGVVTYGFVRAPDGTIDTFGATKGSTLTWPWCINREGTITGYYLRNRWGRGFLRSSGGKLTRFNFEGARGTDANCINDSGVITGYYYDNGFHGFVRAADGTMARFDPQGSIATDPDAINGKGDIAGWYRDTTGADRGFVRRPGGSITDFAVENTDTTVLAINGKGDTAGYFGSEGDSTGFIRKHDGSIEIIAPKGCSQYSSAQDINAAGMTTGYCISNNFTHGFVRTAKGRFTIFDPPDSEDTQPQAINDNGTITGAYQDSTSAFRGFIRTP